jgi:hypothetical protein
MPSTAELRRSPNPPCFPPHAHSPVDADLQVKLLRQADRTLEVLEVDEAKFADELSTQQAEFAGNLSTLSTVSGTPPGVAEHSCLVLGGLVSTLQSHLLCTLPLV